MYDEEKLKQMDAKSIEYPDGSMHTLYEAEQKQRAYERKIRESKRILAAYDESIKGAEDNAKRKAYQNIFDKESVKLKMSLTISAIRRACSSVMTEYKSMALAGVRLKRRCRQTKSKN